MAAIEASSRPSPAQQPAHPGTPPQPPSQSQFHQPSRSTSSTKSTLSALDALPPFPPPAPRSTSPRNGSPGPSAEDDARKSKEEEELEKQEEGSWLTRILITPLLTISFILSLVLIDKRTTRRLHAPTSPSPSSSSKTTSYLSFTTSSTSPGPPSQSTQKDGSAPPPNTVHAKHRKLFRMEITDAFAARDRVLVALVAVGLLALFGFGVATWWVLGWVRESVRGLSL